MEKFDYKLPLRFGMICFVAVLVLGMLMYIFYEKIASSFMFYIAIGVVMLAFVLFLGVWSGITYRRENGGLISLGHAFGAVYIVFVMYLLSGTVSQLLINKVIDPQYPVKLSSLIKQKMEDRFESMNMSDEDQKNALSGITPEKFSPPMIEIAKSMGISLAVSAFVALLIALFIKRGSEDLINVNG
jgi:hypothetical protein